MSRLSRMLDKGRQVIDLTKMSAKIEKEEQNIEKLYANLGRVFYKVHEKAPEIMYEDLFRTITGSEKQIEYLKKEAQLISSRGKCQKCDHDLQLTDLYCSLCGAAVKQALNQLKS